MKNKVKKILLTISTLITYSLLKVEDVFSQGAQPEYGIPHDYNPQARATSIILIPITIVTFAVLLLAFKFVYKKKKRNESILF